jgi:sugar lactone lactonase YvrE
VELYRATRVTDDPVDIAESCRWDAVTQSLLWVDVFTGRLFRGSFDGERVVTTEVHAMPGHLTAVAPVQDRSVGWIVAADQGFFTLGVDGKVTSLGDPEAGKAGVVRMNDGACDPAGRFWAGSMAYDASPGAGSLYRYDAPGQWVRTLADLTISNGIGWSPDGRSMYHVDSGAGTVSVLAYDVRDGTASDRRPLIAIDPDRGVPDGLCVDAHGDLWVAIWGGGEVHRYSPSGTLETVVRLPVSQPTSCALGGPDGRTLFIATARLGLSTDEAGQQPDAGLIFACGVETPGPPVQEFIPHTPTPRSRP